MAQRGICLAALGSPPRALRVLPTTRTKRPLPQQHTSAESRRPRWRATKAQTYRRYNQRVPAIPTLEMGSLMTALLRSFLTTPRRRTQTAVWVLLVVVLSVAFVLSHLVLTPPATAPHLLAAGSQVSGGSNVLTQRGLGSSYTQATAINLLPAWRWQAPGMLYSSLGVTDAIASGMTFVASIVFIAASWVWWVTLTLINLSASNTLINSTATIINAGAAQLGKEINASGLVFLVLAVAAVTVVLALMKGRGVQALRAGVAVLLIVGFLEVTTLAAAKATSSSSIPKGSPAWVAQQSDKLVSDVGGALGSGFGVLGRGSLGATFPNGGLHPSCSSYTQALYAQYDAYSNTKSTTGFTGFGSGGGAQVVTSYLWQQAFLNNWIGAQFGQTTDGYRMFCHQMETSAGIPASQQLAVARAAGWGADAPGLAVGMFEDNAQMHSSLYGKVAGFLPSLGGAAFGQAAHNGSASLLAFAACRVNSNHTPVAVQSSAKYPNAPNWGTDGAWQPQQNCTSWWTAGAVDGLRYDSYGAMTAALHGASAPQDQAVLSTLYALTGHNPSQRLFYGVMALLTALVYLYVLGALALGGFVAQLGAVLLWILLPISLVLFAFPSKGGSSRRNPTGTKLLRLTASFTFAKLLVTVALTLLLETIMTFDALLSSFSVPTGFLSLLVPVISLVILKLLLRKAGLGDVTSLSGATGMSVAAAMAAGGDKNGAGGWNQQAAFQARSRMSSTTLGRQLSNVDARVARTTSRVLRAPGRLAVGAASAAATATGRGAATAAGSAVAAVDQRFAVKERVAQVIGSRTPDGPQGTLGLVQQLQAIAGEKLANAGVAAGKKAHLDTAWLSQRATAFATTADLAGQQREQRRAYIGTTKGLGARTAKQRRNNRLALLDTALAQDRAAAQVRPSLGETVTSDNEIADATGNTRQPEQWHSPQEALERSMLFAAATGLAPGDILVNTEGGNPSLRPRMRNPNGTVNLPQATTEAHAVEMAAHPLHYFPDAQKNTPAEWSDGQRATYFHLLTKQAGAINDQGLPVNMLQAHGIDVQTADGRAEVRQALQGAPSKLDAIHLQVSDREHATLVGYVSSMASVPGSPAEGDRLQHYNDATVQRVADVKHNAASLEAATATVSAHTRSISHLAEQASLAATAPHRALDVKDIQAQLLHLETVKAAIPVHDVVNSDRVATQQMELTTTLHEHLAADMRLADLNKELPPAAAASTRRDFADSVIQTSMRAAEEATRVAKEAALLHLEHDLRATGGANQEKVLQQAAQVEMTLEHEAAAHLDHILGLQGKLNAAVSASDLAQAHAFATQIEEASVRRQQAIATQVEDADKKHKGLRVQQQNTYNRAKAHVAANPQRVTPDPRASVP